MAAKMGTTGPPLQMVTGSKREIKCQVEAPGVERTQGPGRKITQRRRKGPGCLVEVQGVLFEHVLPCRASCSPTLGLVQTKGSAVPKLQLWGRGAKRWPPHYKRCGSRPWPSGLWDLGSPTCSLIPVVVLPKLCEGASPPSDDSQDQGATVQHPRAYILDIKEPVSHASDLLPVVPTVCFHTRRVQRVGEGWSAALTRDTHAAPSIGQSKSRCGMDQASVQGLG